MCKNQNFWQKKKEISQPQTEMVVGLETEKDLEDERRRRASVRSGCLTDRFPEKILQIEFSMEGQTLGTEYRPRKIET